MHHKLPLEMEKMGKEWDECSLAQPHYPDLCLELSRKKSFLKDVSCPQRVMQHTSLGAPTML